MQHLYSLRADNDNAPKVERSMWSDCFLSCGVALVIVFIAFAAMERLLRAISGWPI